MIAYRLNERLHASKDNHFTLADTIGADILVVEFDDD